MSIKLSAEHLPKGSKIVDCKNSSSCDEDLSVFGSCTARNEFGYPEGKPCIFLKLNKILDWQPEFYTKTDELPESMPEPLKTHIKNSIESGESLEVVWVSCEGENPADIENLGNNVEYKSLSGEQGFNGTYFPYENIDGYLTPIVAVQFQSVKRKLLKLYEFFCELTI
jgi:sodium/potassium-transporting ATPase subunit beta